MLQIEYLKKVDNFVILPDQVLSLVPTLVNQIFMVNYNFLILHSNLYGNGNDVGDSCQLSLGFLEKVSVCLFLNYLSCHLVCGP